MTSFARLNAGRGLTDVQVLSAYHALRAEMPEGSRTPDQAEWREAVDHMQDQIRQADGLTDARRRSLLARLDGARDETPDARTFWAARRIVERVSRQADQVADRLRVIAANLGEPEADVRARFEQYMNDIDRSRNAAAPEGYTDVTARASASAGLPQDPGTVHAFHRLEQDELVRRAEQVLAGPQRIERQQMASGTLAEAGYDPDGGRLEVVFHRHGGGVSRVYAYRGVPADVWRQIQTGDAREAYNQHVRNHSEYRYETQIDADLDSAARRCADCGQFASSTHTCPARAAAPTPAPTNSGATTASVEAPAVDRPEPRPFRSYTRSRYVARYPSLEARDEERYDVIALGNLVQLRSEAQSGPIDFPIRYGVNRYYPTSERYVVTGRMTLDRPARGQWNFSTRDLACTCPVYQANYECEHTRLAVRRYEALIQPRTATSRDAAPIDPAAAQAAAEEALRQDWMRSEEGAAEARARWASSPADTYSTDFSAFEADHNAALERKAAGQDPIGFMQQNATNGLCTRESGRGFGVELEFDFPRNTNRDAALAAIGRDLHAAGLTSEAYQQHYHSAAGRGYTDQHQGGWSFESDCTVAGEIVSPIMYDEPETWQNLAKVCDIIKRHGGVASVRTGSHVHVSSPNTTAGAASELVRMVTQHEDVMYRISQNPARGSHRPMRWCGMNRDVPPAGYGTVQDATWANHGHNLGLNLQSVRGGERDHAEIRHWDGTLDPSVIQAQIKVSAAMVAAAHRNSNTTETVRGRESVGSHAARLTAVRGGSRRRLTSDELREDSATVRSFADTLFTRREDKAQLAGLFAVTNWQKVRRR